ncbi:hydroxyproline dehydrogenase, partial [Dryobates pubescens]|uniref:hydroxyproline dehydrogenase n=1 Tax=Dryobates pubescens TaxID=118200 RepID=UPI0023B965DF
LRGLLVLSLCGAPGLVRNAEGLLRGSRRLLGAGLWGALLRATFYGHFVGGCSPGEVQASAGRLRALGLRPMLALPSEQPVGEEWYAANQAAALELVALAGSCGPHPMMQLKVTSLLSARLCEVLSEHVVQAGREQALDWLEAALGGEVLGHAPSRITLSKRPQNPRILAPIQPKSAGAQNRHLGVGLRRLDDVSKAAASAGVKLLVDAELSPISPALDLVTLALIGRHNRGAEPWIWNTYQAYRKDCAPRLWGDVGLALRRGSRCGLKLVRGAYLEQERAWARARGVQDPLQPSLEHTHRSYSECLELALGLVAAGDLQLMVATHNEASVLEATQRSAVGVAGSPAPGAKWLPVGSIGSFGGGARMQRLGVARSGGGVCFGQLLGMCDHVSLALGAAGYAVYKSVPVGAPCRTLPYLARRAQENRGVLGGSREPLLLLRELRRRCWGALGGSKTS